MIQYSTVFFVTSSNSPRSTAVINSSSERDRLVSLSISMVLMGLVVTEQRNSQQLSFTWYISSLIPALVVSKSLLSWLTIFLTSACLPTPGGPTRTKAFLVNGGILSTVSYSCRSAVSTSAFFLIWYGNLFFSFLWKVNKIFQLSLIFFTQVML